MADKDNRYVVTFEAYVYAPNDYMARKRAHDINDIINGQRNAQDSEVKEIGEQPFATMGFRELDDISRPKDKSDDKPLPF